MPRRRHPILPSSWPSRQEAQSARLFAPGSIGPLSTCRRTWIPAMVPWRSNEAGEVTPEVLDWYGRFAEGKPGVLVVEATGIRELPSGPLLRIGHDGAIPGLRRLVETVRTRSEGETRLFIQIIDFLGIRRRPPREKFLKYFLTLTAEHRERLGMESASEAEVRERLIAMEHDRLLSILSDREREDLEFGHRERITDIHENHIHRLPQTLPPLFASAAARAEAAGFDGVELHFAHAYTMASFLSATNTRQDGYGGGQAPHSEAGLAGRLRLPLEVLAATRNAVNKQHFAVGCRLLADEAIQGGTRVAEAANIACTLATAGMDFISLSKGGKFDDAQQPGVGASAYPYTGASGHECMPTVFIEDDIGPFGRNLPLAQRIRSTLLEAGHQTPVIAAGAINSFELAETALMDGACDFVAAARQCLADPDWFLKMETGQGESIRRCKYTNYCEALDERHKQVTCQLWDRDFKHTDSGRSTIARSHDGKRRLIAPPT